MPGNTKQKYYAVRVGRDGPKIYNTWDECKEKVSGFPHTEFRSFKSREMAEEWLGTRSVLNIESVNASREPSQYKDPEPPHPEPAPDATTGSLPQDIKLSKQQEDILEHVKAGNSAFFTGSAGTGKSVLLRAIISHFGGSNSESLAITASTGIASVNIGGCTLHSWAGIGLGKFSAKHYARNFWESEGFKDVKERWQLVQTLIIDEISMIDGKLFDKLEHLARLMRQNNRPFGGIQLILTGDFCQLPPVPDRNSDGVQFPPIFAFEAESWYDCVGLTITLVKVFRQKDQAFVDMLNAIRFGKTNSRITKTFKQLSRLVLYDDGIEPTELFPTRAEVEATNHRRLSQLDVKSHIYNARDTPGLGSNRKMVTIVQMERLLDRLVALKQLELKVGAQVMLIKNLEQGALVNGSLGKIIDFISVPAEFLQDPHQRSKLLLFERDTTWPVVQFTNGRTKCISPEEFTVENTFGEPEATRVQIPLILAYALSVHKSQGQTLERVKIDLRRTFEKGQAYVALSRATTMECLQVLNFDPERIMAHPTVLKWHGIREDNEIYEVSDSDEDDVW